MGSAFKRPEDILNRALQHIRCAQISSRTEQNPNAFETNACYDALRRAELRRNTWRFATRRTLLRPLDYTSVVLAPSTYVAGTTYATGAIVQYPANSAAFGSRWLMRTREHPRHPASQRHPPVGSILRPADPRPVQLEPGEHPADLPDHLPRGRAGLHDPRRRDVHDLPSDPRRRCAGHRAYPLPRGHLG